MSQLKCKKKNVIDRFGAKESFKIMVLLSSEEGKLVPAEKIFFAGFKSPFIVSVMTRSHINWWSISSLPWLKLK